MKIIGVCGGSGAGKSFVSSCLASFGGISLDTDAIYHELISTPSPCVKALVESFGDSIVRDGVIDRSKLREIVFADEEKRQILNQITHPFVMEEVDRRIQTAEQEGIRFAIIDAPLLFEAHVDEKCDCVVGVVSDLRLRVKRIMERDSISEEAALVRLSKQIPDDELMNRCDAIIHNNETVIDLKKQCKDLLVILGLLKKDEE